MKYEHRRIRIVEFLSDDKTKEIFTLKKKFPTRVLILFLLFYFFVESYNLLIFLFNFIFIFLPKKKKI